MIFTWSQSVLFFFKQKTAYEMRISDWSADVCSSDLGEAGDQGCAPVLKKEEDDQKDQDDRFPQGPEHFLDGDADEIGRVERDGPAHPGGKSVIHPFHRRADFVRNAHDVRSGSREDPDDQCRLAALGGETAIVPRAKLDARDIAQPDDLAAAFSP